MQKVECRLSLQIHGLTICSACLEQVDYTAGLCHFCVSKQHGEDAHLEWYGSQIREHYGPYVDLFVRSTDMDINTAKAEARRRLSISRWVREDELYQLVSKLFLNRIIRREASPPWLGQQRLDIFLPELGLAIEPRSATLSPNCSIWW